MSLISVSAGNFKGLNAETSIKLKPITIFIGPNSSGKSTCMHALACLAQSIKITNKSSQLVLDDEYADVHLGRFSEVSHSRDCKTPIVIGFKLDNVQFLGTFISDIASLDVKYHFGCNSRIQEPFLEFASFDFPGVSYQVIRKGKQYVAKNITTGGIVKCTIDTSLSIDIVPTSTYKKYRDFRHLVIIQRQIAREISKIRYLGPFRQSPLRIYQTHGANPKEVGSFGESAIPMFANEVIQSRKREHIKQISGWLSSLNLAKDLSLRRIGTSDLFNVSLKLADGNNIPLADLGYGLSQVIPVLAQCSFAPNDSTLLFEQPEIHLHHLAEAALADIFIETALKKNITILIETHSPEMFMSFVRSLGNKLPLEKFIAYRVSRVGGESKIQEIPVEPNGASIADGYAIYENWEAGISR